jgi:hypothetical protein
VDLPGRFRLDVVLARRQRLAQPRENVLAVSRGLLAGVVASAVPSPRLALAKSNMRRVRSASLHSSGAS